MIKIKFKHDASEVSTKTDSRLLDVMLAQKLPVKMLCGGRGLCATCHVYVVAGESGLTPPTSREKLSLAVLTGAQPSSRLACQARLCGEGVEVALPDGMYVESFAELEGLIGQRTNVPILHPVTGEVLVEAQKIIIRSSIMQLKNVDFSVSSVTIQS